MIFTVTTTTTASYNNNNNKIKSRHCKLSLAFAGQCRLFVMWNNIVLLKISNPNAIFVTDVHWKNDLWNMHWNPEECQSRYRKWHFSKVCNLMKIIFTKNFHSKFGIFWSLEILMGANLAGICKFVLIYDNPPKCWFDKRRGWKTIFQCKINLKLRGKLLWPMTSLTWLENAELYFNFCRKFRWKIVAPDIKSLLPER